MTAIASQNLDPELYVADCFKKDKFLQAYAYIITPLNDSSLWPTDPDITLFPLPPKRRRLPGRPATKRKSYKAERELSGKRREKVSRKGDQQMCTLCHGPGHNKSKFPTKAGTSNTGEAAQTSGADRSAYAAQTGGGGQNADAAQVGGQRSASEAGPSGGRRKKPASGPSGARIRRHSEGIVNIKLGKVVYTKDGCGNSGDKPINL